jgi:hypothetical protein
MTYNKIEKLFDRDIAQLLSNAYDTVDSNPDLSTQDIIDLYEYMIGVLLERCDCYIDEAV